MPAIDALDAIVGPHFDTAGERADAASAIVHEIRRRTRRATMTSSRLKVCPTCNEAKAHADYNRHAGRADGLDSQCRACVSNRRSDVTPSGS